MANCCQAAASRLSGALSHRPTSETGKATSPLHALKTGLTGRTVLLPSEDAALYEAHLAQFRQQELALVQCLADTHWRLSRIPSFEKGIYALGRLEFAGLFPEQEEGIRKQLIGAKIYLDYQRQLANLSIQEGRLRRQAEKDVAGTRRSAGSPPARNPMPCKRCCQSLYRRCAPQPARTVRPEGARANLRSSKSKLGPWNSNALPSIPGPRKLGQAGGLFF